MLRSTTLALYANVAVQTRDRDASATLYQLIEPMSEHVATNVAVNLGHCRTYLGLLADVLGDDDLTDAHMAFACDFHDREQLLLWAARAHLGWAEALSRRRDQRCTEHAARALELARAHGYGAIEARVCSLLKLEWPRRPTHQR